MFHFRLPILALSYFLFNSILAFAGTFDEIDIDNCVLFDSNLVQQTQNLSLLGFGRVYTVVNVVIIVVVVLNVIVYKLRQLQEENSGETLNESSSLRFGCRRFSLAEIVLATNNFEDSLVVGRGGFGRVYKGVIDNGRCTVAIKRLGKESKQGAPQFMAELEMLPNFRHCNIISLIGYCDSFNEMILVYEYVANGTLADHCYRNGNNCYASWAQRLNMCIATARGLNYLHTGTGVHQIVIHRDVKSSNILLDENLIVKITDFGLSTIAPRSNHVHASTIAPRSSHVHAGITIKFEDVDKEYVSTQAKGTFGYIDPDFFITHRLTSKTDVYSFGVVLFEVLSGRAAVDFRLNEKQRGLAMWAKICMEEGTIDQIIDPNLRGQIFPNCLSTFVQIANQCLHNAPRKRPTMAEVVVQLQLALALQERGVSSILKEEVSIAGGTNDRKELADSFRTREVINADNAEHRNGKIDGFISMCDANSGQSSRKPANRSKVTQKAHVFFTVTARAISGIFQQGPLSQVVTTNLKRFTLAELKIATRNFSPDMQLAKGYFQSVFIGWLNKKTYTPSKIGIGMAVAVKKFNVNSPQRFEAWKLEVQLFGKFNHPNLVKLLGYCWEDKEGFIVYEYMQKGSLDKHLSKEGANPLSWDTRLKISVGAARGLSFLHKTENGVIHRKVKTSNILLDGDFNSKLSDFGLAKSGSLEEHIGLTASIAGAYGFLAPEYIATGCWYPKSDVYSFGAVLLEILTGKRVKDEFWHNEEDDDDLVEWARVFLPNKTELKRLIDPRLENDYPLEGAFQFASLVLKCLETFPSDRPSIEQVLETLEQINGINVKHKEKSEAGLRYMDPEASGTSTPWTE